MCGPRESRAGRATATSSASAALAVSRLRKRLMTRVGMDVEDGLPWRDAAGARIGERAQQLAQRPFRPDGVRVEDHHHICARVAGAVPGGDRRALALLGDAD